MNLKHQFFTIQAVVPDMKKAGNGSIINMTSGSWMVAFSGLPVYAAAKAGIYGLTRGLARDARPLQHPHQFDRSRLDPDQAPAGEMVDA